jgi:putative membrane protein
MLHATAMSVWILGMLAVAATLPAVQPANGPFLQSAHRLVTGLHWWTRWITTPAMVLGWALGITVVVMAHWMGAGWLHAKLALVVGLSGLFGVQSAALRRLAGGDIRPLPALVRYSGPIIFVSVVLVLVMVFAKPF